MREPVGSALGDDLSPKIPVSVFVLTKNEEKNIGQCLERLVDFEEVFVVDSMSDDRTTLIAKQHGASVVEFQWNGRYPKKKQWQLDNIPTKNDWVLMLDADEYPSSEFIDAIRSFMETNQTEIAAFDVRLSYWFGGRELKHGHRVVKRALLDRRRCAFPEVDDLGLPGIGEVEGHYQPSVEGVVGRLPGKIEHRDLDPVRTWFERHNKYSEWEAHLLTNSSSKERVTGARSRQGQIFQRLPGKALLFFLYSYLARLGFLDGRAGLDYALALSFYYWQIDVKYRELVQE